MPVSHIVFGSPKAPSRSISAPSRTSCALPDSRRHHRREPCSPSARSLRSRPARPSADPCRTPARAARSGCAAPPARRGEARPPDRRCPSTSPRGEQVAVERRVLRQQPVKRQHRRGRHQFVEPYLPGWDLRPLPMRQPVVGVGPTVSDPFENHRANAPSASSPEANASPCKGYRNRCAATRTAARAVSPLMMAVKWTPT